MDGLSGLSEAIEKVYPYTITQRCVVHIVRNWIVNPFLDNFYKDTFYIQLVLNNSENYVHHKPEIYYCNL